MFLFDRKNLVGMHTYKPLLLYFLINSRVASFRQQNYFRTAYINYLEPKHTVINILDNITTLSTLSYL